MSYDRYYENGWQSGESGGTPITPEALNHMEKGILNSAPAGYGFGEASPDISGRDLLDILAEGKTRRCMGSNVTNAPMAGFAWFYMDCASPDAIVHAWYHSSRYHAVATYTDGVLSEWEWDNPPMAAGVEYRTTQRWNLKPVYTKLINYGALPNTTQKNVYVGVAAKNMISAEVSAYSGEEWINDVGPYGGRIVFYADHFGILTTNDKSSWTAFVKLQYVKE